MPQKFIKDEHKWAKAKEIVKKQYGIDESAGDKFWELVMGVYKQARGTIHKEGRGTYYHHRRSGKDTKRTLPKGKETAPKARKGLESEPLAKAIKRSEAKKLHGDLPEGGVWRTIRGHHVYIKNGKIIAGAFAGTDLKPKKTPKKQLKELQMHFEKRNAEQLTIEPKKKKTTKTKKAAEIEQSVTLKDLVPAWTREGIQRVVAKRVGSYAVQGKHIKNPQDLAEMFADLADDDREKVYVVATSGSKVLGTQCVHVGTLDFSAMHPREILKLPILSDADSFWILHNHPSGVSVPSQQDLKATEKIAAAAEEIGLEFKGHGVIGDSDFNFINKEGEVAGYGEFRRDQIKRTEEINLYETKQEKRRPWGNKYSIVRSPEDLWKHAQRLGLKQTGSTVHAVALNTKHTVVATIPLDFEQDPETLKKDIMRHMVKSNAAAFAIVMGANAPENKVMHLGLRGAGDLMGIELLDVVRGNHETAIREFRSFKQDDLMRLVKGSKLIPLNRLEIVNKSWNESDHPRDARGRFTDKGGGSGGQNTGGNQGNVHQGAHGEGRKDQGGSGSDSGRSLLRERKTEEKAKLREQGKYYVAPYAIHTFSPKRPEDPVVYQVNHAGIFHESINKAKKNNPFGAFVTAYDRDDYKPHKKFLLPYGAAGCAVTPEGDIISVFKDPNSNVKGASHHLLLRAIAAGGKTLDCFDGFLPRMYAQYGFIPVVKLKFDREYAPEGWNYERDGEPDVVFFMHNGDSAEEVERKAGTYPTPDLKNVPYAKDYDEAVEMRKTAMAGISKEKTASLGRGGDKAMNFVIDLQKGIGKTMLEKYPGGRWATMNGTHVYIKKDGKIAAETDPRKGKKVTAKDLKGIKVEKETKPKKKQEKD